MKLSEYLTQNQLDDATFAAQCKVDRTTIFRVREGRNRPSPALMETIAKETGGSVQPNDFFDGLPECEAA